MADMDREEARIRRIRDRAYEIWEEEGRPHGRDTIHWSRAWEEFDAATQDQEAVEAPGARSKDLRRDSLPATK